MIETIATESLKGCLSENINKVRITNNISPSHRPINDFAVLSSRNFVLTWDNGDINYSGSTKIFFKIIKQDSSLYLNDTIISSVDAPLVPRVAAANNIFAVVWHTDGMGNGDNAHTYAAIYSNSGNIIQNPFRIDFDHGYWGNIEFIDNNRFVIVCNRGLGSEEAEVYIRIISVFPFSMTAPVKLNSDFLKPVWCPFLVKIGIDKLMIVFETSEENLVIKHDLFISIYNTLDLSIVKRDIKINETPPMNALDGFRITLVDGFIFCYHKRTIDTNIYCKKLSNDGDLFESAFSLNNFENVKHLKQGIYPNEEYYVISNDDNGGYIAKINQCGSVGSFFSTTPTITSIPSPSPSSLPSPSPIASPRDLPSVDVSNDSQVGKSFWESNGGITIISVMSVLTGIATIVSTGIAIHKCCRTCHQDTVVPSPPIGITLEEGKEISLISFEQSKTYFDYENDGKIEKTSWVSGDDAILVYDYNGNKIVDNAKEIVLSHWCPRL